MPEDTERAAPPSDLMAGLAGAGAGDELHQLRELLLGPEIEAVADLKRRLDALGLTPDELAEHLPAAVARRAQQDKQLARALAPVLDEAFDESVRQNPQKISTAVFPIIGPAIRKAIAEALAGMVQTINRALESSLSWQGIRWRAEAWRTGVPYGQVVIKHALVYRVERIFLIHNETGLVLAHVAAEDLDTPDADVISGMLTAIKDFVQDSFHADASHGMRRLSVAEHTIHAQQGPYAMVGAVVRGHPPESINERLMAILERIHLQYGPALAAFEGDTEALESAASLLAEGLEATPFQGASTLLEEGLETVLRTDDPRSRGAAPRIAWVAAAAVMLVGAVLVARHWTRWTRAVGAMQRTPGIVVADADRRIGRNRLVGLLDPAAPAPDSILEAHGLDPARVEARWEGYVSTDPAVVLARLTDALDTPPSVSLQIDDGGIARATGAASPRWLRDARNLAPSIPGVRSLDLTDVRMALPADLARRQAAIEGTRITFPVGSAGLSADMRERLDSVAAAFAAVQAGSPDGIDAILTITGSTDTTGTEAANTVLSQRRAEVVRDALATLGLPLAGLRTAGDALRGDAAASTAQRDRSVTFSLDLTFRDSAGGSPE